MATATLERPRLTEDELTKVLRPQQIHAKGGIVWERMFCPTEDPYETIPLEQTDILIIHHQTKEVVLEQKGVWYPAFWSQNARNIFAQHYLRGRLGTAERETSVLQSIDRVINRITEWGMHGRIVDDGEGRIFLGRLFADERSAQNWSTDMKYSIVTQKINFNSPVWYNIGVPNVPQQCSACFILHVDDSKDSIKQWYNDELDIFAGGSGSGLDLSNIRSSYEGLAPGGKASGPCSFMTTADSNAGTMSSGGKSRRAAKMVTMGIDHPDIYDLATLMPDGKPAPGFIRLKVRAEEVARTLRDAGFDVSVDSGRDAFHVQYQNANNSVRITNEFMEAVLNKGEWKVKARRPELVWKELPVYKADFLWIEIAKAAWACADPGLQFDTTINHWHTTPAAGRIRSSNPCSEYMHIDNSPCNLAGTNLLKFLEVDESWALGDFVGAVSMMAIAQTILAAHGDYPTKRIAEVARGFRQIGQGYTNLGATIMAKGLPYDSDEGRAWTAAITSLMQATLYRTSAQIAQVWGAYGGVVSDEGDLPGFEHPENRKAHLRVAAMHSEYHRAICYAPSKRGRQLSIRFGEEVHIDTFHHEVVGGGRPVKQDRLLRELWVAGKLMWLEAQVLGEEFGYANAHMSVLAPMGTNGYMMDNDTTGIEPDILITKNKKKVSGDHMLIVNQTIERAVLKLGYSPDDAQEIVEYAETKGSVVKAPHLAPEHYPVFDTAIAEKIGNRFIEVGGHQLMMAAAQPFISGAISKTVNCPEQTTAEEIEAIHFDSWRLGLKSNAIYRDNSKQTQPLGAVVEQAQAGPPPTVRHKLPRKVNTGRVELAIGEFSLFMHYGMYANGQLGEIFFTAGKEGSTVNGLLAGAAKEVSIAVQHGTPVRDVVKMWLNMNFEPNGRLSPKASDFTSCTSVLDLAARELALVFLPPEERQEMNILTREELMAAEGSGSTTAVVSNREVTMASANKPAILSGTFCPSCGHLMNKAGSCYACPSCGTTTGCS